MSEYTRPPVVEAVLEFRLDEPLTERQVRQGVSKLAKYPIKDEKRAFSAKLNLALQKSDQWTSKFDGIGLSSHDRTRSAFVKIGSVGFAELAPYSGWESFSARARSDWGKVREAFGSREIGRMGLRYVNRIDIPLVEESSWSTYLKIGPSFPDIGTGALIGYVVQVTTPVGDGELSATISAFPVDPPVPQTRAIVLDIDVFKDNIGRIKEVDLWDLVQRMRDQKNVIFEACITDDARRLFT